MRFYLLFLATACAVFYPSLRGEFIMDDWGYITQNPHVTGTATPFHFWFSFQAGPDYWPLSYTFYWIFFRLFGENPLGYHLVNVAVHAGNALLVLALGRRLVPGLALPAALLFLVHPLHVQAVSWIIQFKTLLATGLVLGSVLTYFDSRRGLSLALFALSLFAKTSGVALPLALAALDWRPREWRVMVAKLWPYFTLSAVGGAATLLANHLNFTDLDAYVFHMHWYQRPLLMVQNLFFYLDKFVWPDGLAYMYPMVVPGLFAWTVGLFAIALAAGALVMTRIRALHEAMVFFICYLFLLIPALGLVAIPNMKLSLAADHWTYLPNVFLIFMVLHLLAKIPWRPVALAPAYAAIVVAAGLSFRHAETFATEEGFWQRARDINPGSAAPFYNLGTALDKQQRVDEAIIAYTSAINLDPLHARAWYNLGRNQYLKGNLAGAREGFEKAIELDPRIAASFVSLAKVNMAVLQTEKALAVVEDGLKIHPEDPELLQLQEKLRVR